MIPCNLLIKVVVDKNLCGLENIKSTKNLNRLMFLENKWD
jgi:hypothetical protein